MASDPYHEPSLLADPLSMITRLVLRAPRVTIGLAVLVSVAAIAYAASTLSFRTSRLDLLNPKSGYNKLWIDFISDYGDDDDVVVILQGKNREAVTTAMDATARLIQQRRHYFADVLYKVELQPLHDKGLYYLPVSQLEQIERFLQSTYSDGHVDWSSLQVGRLTNRLIQASGDPNSGTSARVALTRHLENLHTSLTDLSGFRSPWPLPSAPHVELSVARSGYLLENNGRLGVILLRLVDSGASLADGSQSIDALRGLLETAHQQFPQIQFGLTGLPVMENDEMRSSRTATIEAAVISLVGVSCLFVAGFGGVRYPLLTVATLLIAIGWTFGYLTLAVGHLNILSISFGIILIGLGIDFGIHFVARYLLLRQTTGRSDLAIQQTAASVGPGILTGGVTTAIAFYSAGLTDFTGVAELGIIAGGGIILCIISALFVLPALIHLGDRHRPGQMRSTPLRVDHWLAITHGAPRLVLAVSLGLTLICASGLSSLWYDHNLLNLQPSDQESVRLEQQLLEETQQSVWYAISIARSPAELEARQRAFEKLDSVGHTEEIISVLAKQVAVKEPIIQRISAQLAALPDRPPTIALEDPTDLARILRRNANITGVPPEDATRMAATAAALLRQPPEMAYHRLATYQQQLAADLATRLHTLRAAADPEPPSLADLPPGLVKRFVGRSGRHLIKVYSKADIWDMDRLERFVHQVRSVDPRATGKPLQTFEASQHMQRSYIHAALYALIGVLMILVIDFRSIRFSLLALLPVGLGLLQMFGLLGLLGIPLNPANMIVLPLILGIGLDDGVHVLHDFRNQQGRYRLSRSTASAVLVTSLTTMVGFGSMMVADHRGLASLGRVLTIGVACCLFTSLVTLTAMLSWIDRRWPAAAPSGPPPDAEPYVDFRLDTSAEVVARRGSEPEPSALRR